MNAIELQKAIGKLDEKRICEEEILLKSFTSLRKYFDPVYHMKNMLPPDFPVAVKVNNVLNDSLNQVTYLINNKIITYSKDSILLKSGTKMLTNMVNKTVKINSIKIKAISLAIIKNILN